MQLIKIRFCNEDLEEEDPKARLIAATREDIMGWLEWILDKYLARSQSNLFQKFKHWRQLFAKHANMAFSEVWRVEINRVCFNFITLQKYLLSSSISPTS